ncbi:MAG: rod-binding protein [Pirellulales bacterium]|nr:rod-binding protein [Pirellulales bacterium]
MDVRAAHPATDPTLRNLTADPKPPADAELKEKFTEFVGQTLFGSMLASMRKTVGKPAYMHGGRTEEVFQQQLDQKIVEELTEASADSIAQPMYDLFTMQRRG